MEARTEAGDVRLAELMGTLSYAADLGLGQPIEHCMRQTVIALRLADRLGETEFERVRLHPYLTDRMLARIPALSRIREIAARHHERLDGSGYPRGLTAASLTPPDLLLAAADVYHALTEPRPHRAALDAGPAAGELRDQVRRGLLDGEAANAVLRAAGHRAPARQGRPAGLTGREVEVLRLLARGHPNKQIAQHLAVSPKTVSNHVEHIYAKLHVSSRATATLFATQHGLMGPTSQWGKRPMCRGTGPL
jgi:DNA-binding CsgD family transcriptional regulator